jgi:hypothetical protein
MYFLDDKERKIAIGWSAKCGCTHIKKIFYYFQNNKIDNSVHRKEEYEKINIEFDPDYIIILIIRNPYERLISGFLNKYHNNSGYKRYLWKKNKELTFKNFVEELCTDNFKILNKHHFTPQLSENWNDDLKERKLFIYDINDIDYGFLEDVFEKNIPKELKENRGGHENKKEIIDTFSQGNIYDLTADKYNDFRPATKLFYNEEIKRDVTIFYGKDLEFFRERGFSYIV